MFKFKHKTHKRFSKLVCTAISVAMILTTLFTFTASATSYSKTDNITEKWIAVDKDSELYQQALSVLDITEDEAAEYNIYSVPEDSSSIRGVTIPNNSGFYYFSEFSFYDDNSGSFWTCQGNQLKWGFTWHPTYGPNAGQYLYVELYEYYNTLFLLFRLEFFLKTLNIIL